MMLVIQTDGFSNTGEVVLVRLCECHVSVAFLFLNGGQSLQYVHVSVMPLPLYRISFLLNPL